MKNLILKLVMSTLAVILSSSSTAPDPDRTYFEIRGELIEEKPAVEEVEHFTVVPEFAQGECSDAFEQTVAFIKKHEGFAGGKAYYCAAGFKTIGYGHVVKSNEHFKDDRITRKEADRLLRHDLMKCIALARKHTSGLNEHQLMAVAHFIFAKGIGSYLKSQLKVKIDNGECPDDEFRKWCKYHKPDGTLVTSQYSLNIRKWEIAMFNTE
ncbi:MAG: lysozyme [Bacteroidales bacterium]|nr:lysozyme [Bacteroidales bacterium]MBO7142456.1 lysozyme [Bacteroidales bacterium]